MARKLPSPTEEEEQDAVNEKPLEEVEEQKENGNEEETSEEEKDLPSLTNFSLFCLIISFILNGADIISDVNLAHSYFVNGCCAYFYYTLACLIIPAFFITGVSSWLYKSRKDSEGNSKSSCEKWMILLTFSLLQFSPLARYAEAFFYGFQSRIKTDKPEDKQKRIQKYIRTTKHANLLAVFISFMESAPQLTLQLCILISGEETKFPGLFDTHEAQLVSVGFSLLGISWSLVSYNRELLPKTTQEGRQSEWRTFCGSGLQLIWFLCTISSRCFALAAFATIHEILIFPVCCLHYILTVVWLIYRKLHMDKEVSCQGFCRLLRDLILIPTAICPAFAYLFAYFKVQEEQLRHKCCRFIFYVALLIEDTILLGFWYTSLAPGAKIFVMESTPNGISPEVLILGDYCLFMTGLFAMSSYYSIFHSNVFDMVLPMQLKNGRVFDVGYSKKNNNVRILERTNEERSTDESFISSLFSCLN